MSNDLLRFRGVELVPLQMPADVNPIIVEICRDLHSRARLNVDSVDLRENVSSTWTYESFAIVSREARVGYVTVTLDRWTRIASIELGILPAHQRRGVGVIAGALIARYLFEGMGLVKLETTCFEFNEQSRRIQERYLTLEGNRRRAMFSQGRYWDKMLFGLFREEYDEVARSFFRTPTMETRA